MTLSQGFRARLEVQRVLLKEKLDHLGSEDPPPAWNQDLDTVSLLCSPGSVCAGEGGSKAGQMSQDGAGTF